MSHDVPPASRGQSDDGPATSRNAPYRRFIRKSSAVERVLMAPFVAVRTTNVFCRPGCPAPAPQPANARRIATAREALFAGFRPCLRCRPLENARPAPTDAELRRAERLRPILRATRDVRQRRSGARAVVLATLPTPLGPMLAGVTDDGVCE